MFGVSGGREFVLDGDTGWGDADAVWEESVVRELLFHSSFFNTICIAPHSFILYLTR